eukprot:CAMPEP_0180249092 /NCGR_PEP_ID=MMETSP0987-20121128/37103_1 /TAXON_ID=697907 /ORGANISM="non described non described, Strain CCMP2293" /LENGTH=63 /DNA_ID=CAMNT_0022217311 /DNA_START=87 /DNA_END=274 /DNA_ORIENTATION=+
MPPRKVQKVITRVSSRSKRNTHTTGYRRYRHFLGSGGAPSAPLGVGVGMVAALWRTPPPGGMP